MRYTAKIESQAIKDAKKIPNRDLVKVFDAIEKLEDNLTGNVKKLTNFTPEFRLRVGNYRVLFEIKDQDLIVYRILHRKESYR